MEGLKSKGVYKTELKKGIKTGLGSVEQNTFCIILLVFTKHCNESIYPFESVILLQIVSMSPWTHLVKSHESQSRTIESQ